MSTGRGVRVAVIDSGVHASHPHIGRIAGGVTIGAEANDPGFTDVIGHGTAVMAAIQEKAPDAEYFAVRVFYRSLRTTVDLLLRAIEWSIANKIDVINLSLGTTNPAHRERFAPVVERARKQGLILVSARDAEGIPALPGSLPGVIGVDLDWECPRDSYRCNSTPEGLTVVASGYPRSLPGVPPARNLHGISFAVANASGFVVQLCEGMESRSYDTICAALGRKDTP
ncbi:MAG TPA: S8 family serine peptidase [Bryobacteraceae bacterium]|nr:S8 family serine peptidase [Bryobacteraceae bacterium]